METTYINIFGGPGAGKSTTATSIFAEFKKRNVGIEFVDEVAKGFVWEDRFKSLTIQPYVTMKQYRDLIRVQSKVKYVVTDGPLILGALYAGKYATDLPKSYSQLVVDLHHQVLTPSINILLERSHQYDPTGRYQTELEAHALDVELENILTQSNVEYFKMKPQDTIQFLEGKI